ncbi:XrtN system VIT domain-containing protein [Marinigracilibium pacificum]|uniref:XrtN system VIT domain-containing protein n=1 Tax=Marinigracilibium pacificum TaxID=2729599 RepID=A0A848J197_9BACT|nr:XrtN system VIT domain-containing protein [Marinigracilibium pacificum]NMM48254.1 XrtN system VIT domain-containing protein [Marinigracilibium pacificum]
MKNNIRTDQHIIVGVIIFLINTLIFLAEITYSNPTNDFISIVFFINYSLSIAYFIYLWVNFKKRFFKLFSGQLLEPHLILLLNFNICAYSLNQTIEIFFPSSLSLSIFICLESLIILTIAFIRKKPLWLIHLCVFIISIGLVFHIYQLIMVLPFSGIAFMAMPFLGISLLLFVPLFYLIGLIKLSKSLISSYSTKFVFITGISLCIIACAYSSIKMYSINKQIEELSLSIDSPFSVNELPDWIRISQKIEDSFWLRLYLKSDIVYQPFTSYSDDLFSFRRFNQWNVAIHEPIIAIAGLFIKNNDLSENNKLKILNYLYNKRHDNSDRFWSGDNLTTSKIVNNVEIFPELRISFTELILSIKNNYQQGNSQRINQQEAVYTFQLPEGGVVSSLSLWIEGIEQKGILTTKEKAETAYNSIVGFERRDPSVVYWMEGNKIRAKVFPCTPLEDRKFKIGISAPVKVERENLIYIPVTFEGPSSHNATQAINILVNGVNEINVDSKFERTNNGLIQYSGDYMETWMISMKKPELKNSAFTFHDNSYKLVKAQNKIVQRDIKTIYLDLTNNWKKQEIESIQKIFENCEIIYFDFLTGKPKSINQDIELINFPNFSLFPYYKIDNCEQSLVITKGEESTPNLSDLKKSKFATSSNQFFTTNTNAPLVLDIGQKTSDYNQSLKQFHVIDYTKMSLDDIFKSYEKGIYPTSIYSKNIVQLPGTDACIIKESNSVEEAKGVDHLLRLFSYYKTIDDIGKSYFEGIDSLDNLESLNQITATANIVTPVSSLIVLETQRDYDRFDIEAKKDSLGNAKINNSGEAPEPHEWALIIIGFMFLFSLYRKKLLKYVSATKFN